jgi:hypothetical protein
MAFEQLVSNAVRARPVADRGGRHGDGAVLAAQGHRRRTRRSPVERVDGVRIRRPVVSAVPRRLSAGTTSVRGPVPGPEPEQLSIRNRGICTSEIVEQHGSHVTNFGRDAPQPWSGADVGRDHAQQQVDGHANAAGDDQDDKADPADQRIDAAELVGSPREPPIAARLPSCGRGDRMGRSGGRGSGLPGRPLGRRCSERRCGCHGNERADRGAAEPSGNAPKKPGFRNQGDPQCRAP